MEWPHPLEMARILGGWSGGYVLVTISAASRIYVANMCGLERVATREIFSGGLVAECAGRAPAAARWAATF